MVNKNKLYSVFGHPSTADEAWYWPKHVPLSAGPVLTSTLISGRWDSLTVHTSTHVHTYTHASSEDGGSQQGTERTAAGGGNDKGTTENS